MGETIEGRGGRTLELRPYREGDEDAILALFEASFRRPLPLPFWHWRFRDNPAGAALIELAWDGDRLAGHYLVTPVRFRIGGRDVTAALSGTTMTHPDYRGIGLFPALARRVYARAAEAGCPMVYGYPNDNSHRGLVQDLGWRDLYEVPSFRWTPGAGAPVAGDGVREVAWTEDPGFDALWERAREGLDVALVRDASFLRWRFAANPDDRYRAVGFFDGGLLRGYAVWKRYGEEVQVVDLLTDGHPDAPRELAAGLAAAAAETGAAAVSMWLGAAHPVHRALEKLGFRNAEPITYMGVVTVRPDAPSDLLHDYFRWYATRADSDVY